MREILVHFPCYRKKGLVCNTIHYLLEYLRCAFKDQVFIINPRPMIPKYSCKWCIVLQINPFSIICRTGVYLLIEFSPCFHYWLNRFLLLISGLTIFMGGLGANFEHDLKNYFNYLFFHRCPTHKLCFLSCRPFIVNTFSTGLVVSSVSWLEQDLLKMSC